MSIRLQNCKTFPENYKKQANEIIFTLKNMGLQGYIDGIIMKPAHLLIKKNAITKVK